MAEGEEQPEQQDGSQNATPEMPTIIGEDDPTFLVRTEVRKGVRPGDDRVRWELSRQSAFRRVSTGLLEATKVTQLPRSSVERLKRFLIGAPLATHQAEQERLTKFKALAVLSSDAISSVAYGTEAILVNLVAAGSGHLWVTFPISVAIVVLLAIVALSYRQTIPAYPNGGGSYIVAKDNLGVPAGLVAAASLLIDYILTVSVSISSGVQNLASLIPALAPYVVLIDVFLVIVVTLVNLRGVRESGTIFSLPTYLFIVSALLLIAIGCVKSFFVAHHPFVGQFQFVAATEPLSIFLVLKSFAAGCSAMTGVEAISNGIPAFKRPETRNARVTLTWMAVILGTLFIGVSVLAMTYHVEANSTGNPTVIAQIATQVFSGPLFFMFVIFQLATLLILTLAANTSYSDFPRLASLLARDKFMPGQFAFRGDRLAFSIGIIFLAILAGLLLIVFKGDTTNLINLYAIGVFMSFTLSQGGMVRHWWRLRGQQRHWQRSMLINGLGALTTLVVALVIAFTKFLEGAWIVVILIPLLVLMFVSIHRHYQRVAQERVADLPIHPRDIHHRLIVPIAQLNSAAQQSLAYARSFSDYVTAVHVAVDAQHAAMLRRAWDEWQTSLADHMQLEIIDAPGTPRPFLRPLLHYIMSVNQQHPGDILTVILPESVSRSRLLRLFENREILQLKIALYFRTDIVVTNVSQEMSAGEIPSHPRDIRHRLLVPIAGLDRVAVQSLAYGRSISPRVVAAHVSIEANDTEAIRASWEHYRAQLPAEEETKLVVIESPYRSLLRPLLSYIDTLHELHPKDTLTVILPEFVVDHWWERILHNQTAAQIKTALLSRPGIIVTNIPQHLRKNRVAETMQKRITS